MFYTTAVGPHIRKAAPGIATLSNPSRLRPKAPEFEGNPSLEPNNIPKVGGPEISDEHEQIEEAPSMEVDASVEPLQPHDTEPVPKADDSCFGRLPPKIREMKYKYTVVENTLIALKRPSPPVSRTSQLIRNESLYIYYRENTFKLTVYTCGLKRLIAFFENSEHSDFVRLTIWHKLLAETPTPKANLWDWVEKSYYHQAPLLDYAHTFVERQFDHDIHAHRISILFGVLRDCQLGKVDWEVSKKILTKMMVGLGVCGERKVDRS